MMIQRRREIFSRLDASGFLVRVQNLMLAYPHCKIIVNIDPGLSDLEIAGESEMDHLIGFMSIALSSPWIHIPYLTCTVEVRNEARKVVR